MIMIYKIIEIAVSAILLFIFYELLTDGFKGIQGKIKKTFMNITGWFFGGLSFHIIKGLQRKCRKLGKKACKFRMDCIFLFSDDESNEIRNDILEIADYQEKLGKYNLFKHYNEKDLYNMVFEYVLFESQMEIKLNLLHDNLLHTMNCS